MTQRSQSIPPGRQEQDLELLSAYLDNELTTAERINLERRFTSEPRLQRELDDLRTTVGALRTLEPVRPPRSFTLDPAKVARPRPFFPLTWVMQMGSGLAGFALVLLATVQLLAAGAIPASPLIGSAAPAPTSAPAAMEAPMAAESAPMAQADSSREAATEAPAATMAPAATLDPAAGAMMLPTDAAAAAGAAAPAADAPAAASEPAGGENSGPTSNSEPPVSMGGGMGGGMGGDPLPAPGVQSSESSSPDTIESALEQQPLPANKAAPGGINPGITLTIGVLLIGLAVAWNVASRRRA